MLVCAVEFIHDVKARPVTIDTIFNMLYHTFSVVLIGTGLITGFWFVSWTAFPVGLLICWGLSKLPRFRKVKFEFMPLAILADSKVFEMLQQLPPRENSLVNDVHGLTFPQFLDWLVRKDEISRGENLKSGQVPHSTFWLYADGKPVGMATLRHRLTKELEAEGGHADFAVVPGARGKGYSTRIVKYLLAQANEMGMESILLTIDNDNTAAIKAAERAGGEVAKVTASKHFIWINC
jgi:predicted acetyltransferase